MRTEKNHEIRLETRLTHKKDREIYARLKSHEDFDSLGDAALLRVALRELDRVDAFHNLLVQFEKRMSGSLRALHKRIDQLETENQILMAFLEVFMRTYYFHTLTVPAEARKTAAAEADRRARKFIEDVASLLQKGGAAQQITVQLNASKEGLD